MLADTAKMKRKNNIIPRVLSPTKRIFTADPRHPGGFRYFGGSTKSFVPERKIFALNR